MRAIALAALCALSCDDQQVIDKVTSALEHGAVSAQIVCEGTFSHPDGTRPYKYEARLLADGSQIMSGWALTFSGGARMCSRTDDCLFRLVLPKNATERLEISVVSGDLVLYDPGITGPTDTPDAIPIGDDCVGFNTEAFQ